jgi:hypothetical protein
MCFICTMTAAEQAGQCANRDSRDETGIQYNWPTQYAMICRAGSLPVLVRLLGSVSGFGLVGTFSTTCDRPGGATGVTAQSIKHFSALTLGCSAVLISLL